MRVVALALLLACATARADDAGIVDAIANARTDDAGIVEAIADARTDDAAVAARVDEEADIALRAAIARSHTDPEGALADLEALGARRPLTRWSDNAWSEAARLAEAAGDFTRARHALAQVIAIDMDAAMVRRARATLDRLAANTGDGQWDAIAKRHEQLLSAIFAGGDPHEPLAELEALVRANPAYPRTNAARASIARGWELEGDADLALMWMRSAADAAGVDERGQRTRLELARMAIRTDSLDIARDEVRTLRANAATDRAALADVESDLASAERRQWLRRGVWALLALLAIAALVVLARDLASSGAQRESNADAPRSRFAWRAAARRLLRPPIEALFMLPLAVLVGAIAATGNPLVARAIITIATAGTIVAWVSGVLVDVAREGKRLRRSRLAIHVVCVALAIACIVFLAVERGGVFRLLVETWRGGHALR